LAALDGSGKEKIGTGEIALLDLWTSGRSKSYHIKIRREESRSLTGYRKIEQILMC